MKTPVILNEGSYDLARLETFRKEHKIWQDKDIYVSQLTELFQITYPHLLGTDKEKEKLAEFIARGTAPDSRLRGNYVYLPWSGLLFHMVGQEDLTILRTNRTRNLVNPKEQQILGKFTAGVVGLSFGNGIALALAYSGASDSMKIADRDTFETTNLNRVRVGLPSVGELKTEVTLREIYEINPYADIKVYSDGVTEQNIRQFISGNPPLRIVFDVVDDFAMKIRLRLTARRARIPVVMLTSLEDSVLVDVERFDLDPQAEIFHGLLGNIADEMLTRKMTEQDKVKYAMAIVGPENVSFRNLLSLSDIGSKLVSRPHLYGTVSIVCGLAAYITKRIALGEDMPSLRTLVPFHKIIGIAPNHADTPEARARILTQLKKRAQG